MANALQVAGSQGSKQTRYAPIWTNRFWTGLWTQRNPLRDAATPYLYEKFYSGSRYDSLIGGLNTEVTSRLTIARAPGSSAYNSQTFPPIDSFYEFRQFGANSTENISVIADTSGVVYDATGPNTQTVIFNKSLGSGQTYFQGVGNTLYFADGIDQEKYLQINGTWTTQLWGIVAPAGNVITGPTDAGLGSDIATAGQAWSNPTNIQNTGNAATVILNPATPAGNTGAKFPQAASTSGAGQGWIAPNNITKTDGLSASVQLTKGQSSAELQGKGFALNVPGNSLVTGIVVTVKYFQTNITIPNPPPPGNTISSNGNITGSFSLLKSGVAAGSAKATGSWPFTNSVATFGNSTDLWGTTWTPAQVNASSFGAQLQSANAIGSTVVGQFAAVDSITITVYYSAPTGTLISHLLQGSTYGFSIPAANIINGIAVKIKGFQAGAGGSLSVSLLNNGVVSGTPKTGIQLSTSNNFITLGGASDLWGSTWYPSDVNLSTFGVSIQATNPSTTSQNWYVYRVEVTIYSYGAPTVTVAAGSLNVTTGYFWAYAYFNANTGHVSTASGTFSLLGAQTSKEYKIPVIASADPQVTNIILFRSLDGGSAATLFQVPQLYANASATITDNNADSTLNTFSQAPLFHSNDPPPAGSGFFTYHLGRVWGAVGNTVFYSQASLGAVPGVTAESWPPANFFTFPALVNRLFPCAVGLMVFTTSDVYLIPNIQTSPYFGQPYVYIQGLGLLSFNAFTVNGTNPIVMTSDDQVIAFDPTSGLIEWGFPIGDILESAYTSTNAYLTWHISGSKDKALYVADGQIGWYRVNPITTPEQGLAWSPQRQIVGGTSAVQSIETSPGIHSLLIGPAASGPILQRSYATNQDNGVSYPANFTIGSIILAHPGQTAILDFITTDCTNQGSAIGIGVLLDEIFGTFESLTNPTNATDPPQLPPSSSLGVNRWYFTTSEQPAECRHLQIQGSWPAENFQNELLSYSIFGSHFQEK